MRLQGTVLNVTPVSGTSASGTAYSFNRISVLTADTRDVVEARLGSNPQPIPVPTEGDIIDLDVTVGAYRDRVQVQIVGHHRDREPVLLGA